LIDTGAPIKHPLRLACLLRLPALVACTGPKPTVLGYEVQPPAANGGEYRASVTIRNDSGGEGEVQVTVRLIVVTTGATAAIAEQTPTLKPHETVHLTISLQPALPGPYRTEVEAEYPT